MTEAETSREEVESLKEKETLETNEEEETSETSDEETEKTEEAEKPEKSKDLQSALAQKEHFRTKLEKAEAEKKILEERLKGFSSQTTGTPMEAVRLGKALAEHSEEEADAVITYAKGKFNTLTPTPEQIIQASKDEWITTAITARREKVANENKTPEPSSPSSVVGGKTADELAKMSDKEYAKWVKENVDFSKIGRSGI